jgi:hypothetical protein
MKYILFLPIFFYSFQVLGSNCLIGLSSIEKHTKLPQQVQDLYEQSIYLGIAVVDHEKFPGFSVLKELIKTYGSDLRLKTIVVEDSAIFAPLYEKMSVLEPESDEDKSIPKTKQYLEIYLKILPLVREVNKRRRQDPLLVVPIDSMNDSSGQKPMYYNGPITRPPEAQNLFPFVDNYYFVMSINREKETAQNFEAQISNRFPNRKSIIIYHAAHIFDELMAYGYEIIGQSTEIRYDYLGWMGFFLSEHKTQYKKFLVDTPSRQNPEGSICWPTFLLSQQKKDVWFSTSAENITEFNSNSFLGRYREGTVALQAESLADFYLLSL